MNGHVTQLRAADDLAHLLSRSHVQGQALADSTPAVMRVNKAIIHLWFLPRVHVIAKK